MTNEIVQRPTNVLATLTLELKLTLSAPRLEYVDPDFGFESRELAWVNPSVVTEAVGQAAENWLVDNREYFQPATATQLGQCIELLSAIPHSATQENEISPRVRHAAYEIALGGMPYRFLRKGVEQALRICRWRPSPAELRALSEEAGGEEAKAFVRVRAIATARRDDSFIADRRSSPWERPVSTKEEVEAYEAERTRKWAESARTMMGAAPAAPLQPVSEPASTLTTEAVRRVMAETQKARERNEAAAGDAKDAT